MNLFPHQVQDEDVIYRRISLTRNCPPVGPYSGNMLRALWWSEGGWVFHMSEVPLYSSAAFLVREHVLTDSTY